MIGLPNAFLGWLLLLNAAFFTDYGPVSPLRSGNRFNSVTKNSEIQRTFLRPFRRILVIGRQIAKCDSACCDRFANLCRSRRLRFGPSKRDTMASPSQMIVSSVSRGARKKVAAP